MGLNASQTNMLLVYLRYLVVFFYSLITYACRIIAVYRYRATLVNLIYSGFAPLLTVVLCICLNLGLNLQFISTHIFFLFFGAYCVSQF